ncbi:LysR family transcriptional regulator [Defluviimonas sp. WL0002]|uniref:LysR family transcriptional regulator n=1 Tax=Albidovulum marisflavi TaxID=2984159 RepID=A0ABT2ZEV3_9RHOB|nr:LysR family transcriptional regulator [Defluviimonas sp. WL0002]MCV2869668.1 LysR family transcriptional regulator [Defluviimonas sp. WL0002]
MTARAKTSRHGLKLRFVLPDGSWLGPGKADLLQGIAETGSISAAGRRLGMSYKRAWGLVEVLNDMFAEPLVTSSRGGAGHGGAALTDTGQLVLRLFRTMQANADRAVADDMAELLSLADMSDKK